MRAFEFSVPQKEILDEIAMDPTSLSKAVQGISGALAGMEFEMYVPDVTNPDGNSSDEPEMDYSDNPRIYDIDSIEDFFYGDHNSRRMVRDAITTLTDTFNEWKWNQFLDDGREWFDSWLLNNGNYDPDDPTWDSFEEYADVEWKYITRRPAGIAFEEWVDETEPSEMDFLRSEGYVRMSDLVDFRPGLSWPNWTYPESSGGSRSIEYIAYDFSKAIGRKANWSEKYHGCVRTKDAYCVEPDGSLDNKDDDTDMGLEFISPPLPIAEMIKDLELVKQWANSENCYTNSSTGLHMNVSIPGFSLEKVDFVKLTLLLGDNYILDAFDRASSTYCGSTLKKIQSVIDRNPVDARMLFNQMRKGLDSIAANILRPTLNKYMSINPQTGKSGSYIEFRSPGGDWLNATTQTLVNTMLRFVVVLDAAMDSTKYRQEYLKKLYKLLSPVGQPDIVKLFSEFSTGALDKQYLVTTLRRIKTERDIQRGKVDPNQNYWWAVKYGSTTIEVVAKNEVEAKGKAYREIMPAPAAVNPEIIAMMTTTRLSPYQQNT